MEDMDTPRIPAPAAALIGLLGVLAALGAGHLAAGVLEPGASPLLAVGNAAIDATPAVVKDFAVRTFGTADKLVLLIGMAVVLAGLGVLAGLLSRRAPRAGQALAVGLGALGMLAVYTRPDLGQFALLAPAVSLFAGLGAFTWLHGRALDVRATDGLAQDRRRFLLGSVAIAAGAGLSGLAGQLLGRRVDVAASQDTVAPVLPRAAKATPIPPGADFAADGTPTFLTPNADFYRIDTAFSVPRLRAEDWELRIHGMVERELRISFADLVNRPLVERTITMTCVSNEVGGPYVSTATFTGVDLRALLLEAGVKTGADQLATTSSDGWTCGTPLSVLLEPDRGALLAIGMNGRPLPAEHGFPVRMVTPGLYGYVGATKWIVEAEVTTFADFEPYWIRRGWGRLGPVKTQSRVDRPNGFAKVPAGRVVVAGTAWAQHTGVSTVEVRVDGGPWRTATLSAESTVDTWRMWRAEFDLAPGGHTVECRATDRSGYTQTAQRADVVPDGATGWHSKFFTVT
ncbi:molybdopterin-dependent oxidoreductase [Crossiella cryophila]